MEMPGAQLGELNIPPRPKFHSDVPLRWGIVLGLLMAGWFELFYQLGWYLQTASGLWILVGNMALVAVCLAMVARTIRRRDAHVATFARIFFYCILTGFAAGLVLSVHELIFNLYLDPDYSIRLLENQRAQLEALRGSPNINPQRYQEMLEANRMGLEKVRGVRHQPGQIVMRTVASTLLYCGIYGALMAIIFRSPSSWIHKNEG